MNEQDIDAQLAELDRRVAGLEDMMPAPTWRLCNGCELIFNVGVPRMTGQRPVRFCPCCGNEDLKEGRRR